MSRNLAQFFHLIPDMERDYCMSIGVRAGDHVFIGGLTATDLQGNELHHDDAGLQMKAIYEQLRHVLTAHGGGPGDVVSEMIYYSVSGEKFVEELFPHRQAFYAGTDGPSVAAVQVVGFTSPAIRVESTVVAYLPLQN